MSKVIKGRTKLSDGEYTYKSLSLERVIADQIRAKEGEVSYETTKIGWIQPESHHKYTADFTLLNGIIIEAKGIFDLSDRKKHLWIKEQSPHLDIRFVFQNANAKLRKGAKSTYGDWCIKHGFLFATKVIPDSWFEEKGL